VGVALGPVVILMALITAWEVILRYFFNSPTRWVWPTNDYLLTLIGLGGGYCLLKNIHIKVDLFSNRFSKRTQALVDIITAPLFFVFVGFVLGWTIELAIDSFLKREIDPLLYKYPIPVYVQKALTCIAALLLFIQGVSKFIGDFRTLISGGEKEKREEAHEH
jgi:TRAP-type mannitol/chloroaromatic compound transport system permease small subunit